MAHARLAPGGSGCGARPSNCAAVAGLGHAGDGGKLLAAPRIGLLGSERATAAASLTEVRSPPCSIPHPSKWITMHIVQALENHTELMMASQKQETSPKATGGALLQQPEYNIQTQCMTSTIIEHGQPWT